MADPTVPVAPPSQAVQAAAIKELNQVLAAIGTVQSLPSGLPTPDRAVVLTGTVLPPAEADNPSAQQQPVAVIQTALGNLTLTLTAALPPGPITVQIQPGSPATASILVPAPANQPAAAPVAQNPAPVAAETETVALPALAAATVPPAPPATVGQVLVGTFIPAALAASTVQTAIAVPPAAAIPPPVTETPSPLAANASLLAQESASSLDAESAPVAVAPASVRQVFLVLGVTPPAGAAPAAASLPSTAGAGQPSLAQSMATQQVAPPSTAPIPAFSAPANAAALTPSQPGGPAVPTALAVPAMIAAPSLPAGAPPLALAAAPLILSTAPPMDAGASALPVVTAPGVPPAATQITQPVAQGPSGNAPSLLALSPTSPFAATVIASTSNQQPVLAVPTGTIIISQPVAVRTGTTLSLQVLTPDQATALKPALPPGLGTIDRASWPALQQSLTSLAGSPVALTALARFIPTLGQDFASTFVAYLTREGGAGKAGDDDPGTILRNLKLDEATAPGLRAALGLLQGEVLGKANTPTVAQGWQNFPVPLLTDTGLSLMQVYLHQQVERRDDEGGLKTTSHNTTRFLLEVHPSALGPVQLDGLLRQAARQAQVAAPHLDLIVRSEAGIPAEDAQELQGLFINALAATGLTGRLSFQYGRENFIQPASGVGVAVEVKI
jgi:hypothetical protein